MVWIIVPPKIRRILSFAWLKLFFHVEFGKTLLQKQEPPTEVSDVMQLVINRVTSGMTRLSMVVRYFN